MNTETTATPTTINEIDKLLDQVEKSTRTSLASLEAAILDRRNALQNLNKVGIDDASKMIADAIKFNLQAAREKMIAGCAGATRLNAHVETPDVSSLDSGGGLKWREKAPPSLVLQPFRFLEPLDVLAIVMNDDAIEAFSKDAARASGCEPNRPSPEQLHAQAKILAADLEKLVHQRNDLQSRMASLLVARPNEPKPSAEPQNFGNFVVLPEDPNRPTPRVIITGN